MAASQVAAQHGLSEHSHGGNIPIQTRSERKRSGVLADFPEISKREEQYRYLDAERLAGLDQAGLDEFSGDISLVSSVELLTEWITSEHSAFGAAGLPEDRPSAAAWEAARAAYLLSIPGESVEPITAELTLRASSFEPEAFHLVIQAERHSHATIVVDHRGKAKLGENVEILVGDEANLTVISIQDWDDGSVHNSAHFVKVGRNAHFKHVVISLGGKTVRITPSVAFTAPGAEIELFGLYFADAGQYLEHRLFVDHAVANCKSRVKYKGALQGDKAHTVWVGDVLIRAAAEGTDTYEMNRNLMLSDGARADSVPNLEIETGQIEGAGHASASGRFDDEQLFYLQARGLTESESRRLVVRGFLNEIIQQIGVPEVESRLIESIEQELERGRE